MPERLSVVEGHTQVGGLLLVENLLQRVAEPQDGRGVDALGVDGGPADEGIVGTEDDGVCVKEEQFLHNNIYFHGKITKF